MASREELLQVQAEAKAIVDTESLARINAALEKLDQTVLVKGTIPYRLQAQPSPWNSQITRGQIENRAGGNVDWTKELSARDRSLISMGETFPERQALFNKIYENGTAQMVSFVRDPQRVRELQAALKEAIDIGDTASADRAEKALIEASVPYGGADFAMFRENPRADWGVFNLPGFTLNDFGDLTTAVGPGLGGAAGAVVGTALGGPPGMLIGAFLGGAGGKGVEEGAEYAMGTQKQSPLEVGGEMAFNGALEALYPVGALAFRGGREALRLPGRAPSLRDAIDYENMAAALESAGAKAPRLSGPQVRTSNIDRAVESNVDKPTGIGRQNRLEVSNFTTDELRRRSLGELENRAARNQLADDAMAFEQSKKAAAMREFPTSPVRAGTAGQEAAQVGKFKTTQENKRLYRAMDLAAEKEQPVFSLNDLQSRLSRIEAESPTKIVERPPEPTGLVDPSGRPIMSAPSLEATAEVPQAWKDVSSLVRKIREGHTEQIDYKLLRQWRNEADKMADWGNPAPDKSAWYARRIRSEIDNSLKSPINRADTGGYLAAESAADAAFKKYSTTMENVPLRTLLDRGASVERIVADVARDPIRNLPQQVMAMIRKGGGDGYDRFREGVQRQMLVDDSGGIVRKLYNLRAKSPETTDFLFPRGEWRKTLDAGKLIDEYSKSPAARIADSRSNLANQMQALVEKFDDPTDLREFLGGMGDPELPRSVLYRYLETKSLKKSAEEQAERVIDAGILGRAVDDLDKRGVLEQFLTPDEVTQLKGISALARRAGLRPGGVAAALELQKLVSDLTFIGDPTKMVSAYVEILAKGRAGQWLLRKSITPDRLRRMAADARSGKLPVSVLRTSLLGGVAQASKALYETSGTEYGMESEEGQ